MALKIWCPQCTRYGKGVLPPSTDPLLLHGYICWCRPHLCTEQSWLALEGCRSSCLWPLSCSSELCRRICLCSLKKRKDLRGFRTLILPCYLVSRFSLGKFNSTRCTGPTPILSINKVQQSTELCKLSPKKGKLHYRQSIYFHVFICCPIGDCALERMKSDFLVCYSEQCKWQGRLEQRWGLTFRRLKESHRRVSRNVPASRHSENWFSHFSVTQFYSDTHTPICSAALL